MKRTIIYVFGPTRLSAQYYSNTKLNLDDGGWLKIGQTSEEDDNVSKWDSALKRIGQESRTGLPEVCRLFDVFEYPAQAGKTDDKVRKLLTEDIYCLECSAAHNKEIEKREIKAGCEFVYGITRSQVLNAVVKFEHNLILENYGKEGFEELMEMIQGNNDFDEIPFEPNPDEESDNAESTATSDDKTKWCNNLWDKVIEKIKGEISVNISNPKEDPTSTSNLPTTMASSTIVATV